MCVKAPAAKFGRSNRLGRASSSRAASVPGRSFPVFYGSGNALSPANLINGIGICCLAEWGKDMTICGAHVCFCGRYWGQSLFALHMSACDPKRRYPARHWCANLRRAKRHPATLLRSKSRTLMGRLQTRRPKNPATISTTTTTPMM